MVTWKGNNDYLVFRHTPNHCGFWMFCVQFPWVPVVVPSPRDLPTWSASLRSGDFFLLRRGTHFVWAAQGHLGAYQWLYHNYFNLSVNQNYWLWMTYIITMAYHDLSMLANGPSLTMPCPLVHMKRHGPPMGLEAQTGKNMSMPCGVKNESAIH